MNKYIIISISLLFINGIVTAQLKDTSVGTVFYAFRHMVDTNNAKYFREENMALSLGKFINEYYSVDKVKKDSLVKAQIEQSGGMVINTSGKKVTSSKIFVNKFVNKIVVNETLLKLYYYEDSYPKIEWKIADAVKEIGGIKCTKAMGDYKGRTYEAWFSTELGIEGAPWKLVGLPGLVLEAYDVKMQVQFLFAGIEKISGKVVEINYIPLNGIKTTKVDYLQLKEAAANNPAAFINSASSDAGMGFKISSDNSAGNFKPKKLQNPIELIDN